MKKKYLAIALALLCKCSLWAQDVRVKSFSLDPTDLTAQHENVKDANGEMCALIKVQIVDDKVTFGGDIIGEPKHNQNEYDVYVVDGTQRLTISTASTLPTEIEFSQYGIEELKGGSTYVLKMEMPENAPGVTFEVGMQHVQVIVDGKEYQTDEMGALDLPLAKGTHSYSISLQGYKKQEGTIVIDKIPVVKDITMERGDGLVNKGLLSITYPKDATLTIIPLNSSLAPAKKTYITGEQIPLNGDYQITINKKKYVPKTISVTVKPGDNIRKPVEDIELEAEKKLSPTDYAKLFKEYKKMAEKGDDLAQYKLGCCYSDGKGTAANLALAKAYWHQSAQQGNLNAYRKLLANETSVSEQMRLLQKMVDYGDSDALIILASIYAKQSNWDQMKDCLKKSCAMGNPLAYCLMGELYYEGKGCVQNYSRAYKYFAIAASHDNSLAKERMLDYQYLGLDGHKQNKSEAVSGYCKLGSNLSEDGLYKVGMFYYEQYDEGGNNLYLSLAKHSFSKLHPETANVHWTAKAQDVFYRIARLSPTNEAVFYYRLCESAGAKSADIYNQLGTAYRLGNGVNANADIAFDYYQKSQALGDKEGICWLGFCYEKGLGTFRNIVKAVNFYKEAESMGSTTAAGYLGTLYAQGVGGLPKDMKKAVALWTRAGNDNKLSAIRNLIRYYQQQKNNKQVQYWNGRLKKVQSEGK